MSRIGRKPIPITSDLKVSLEKYEVTVEGPKGRLSCAVPDGITVKQQDSSLIVERANDSKPLKQKHGLVRSLIANMVEGVKQGFKKELEIIGVGYKAQLKGKNLILQVGFSHPVEITPPEGIKVSVPAATRIVVEGIDKQLVGQFAAKIRELYPPEPYKGKGIRLVGEYVRKKLGKAMAK